MTLTDDVDFNRGLAMSVAGDFSAAITAFESAAMRFPDDPTTFKQLGMAYARRGEFNVPEALKQRDASTDAGSLGESVSEVIQAAFGLAYVSASKAVGLTDWIVRYREDFRRGSVALKRSISLSASAGAPDSEAYHVLSQCLRYLGQTEAAREAAQAAFDLAPKSDIYEARVRAIEMLPDRRDAPEAQRTKWSDVILPARTKRELRQMQLMIENPKLAASLGVEPPTGLLLHGRPGTGKTTVARVLACEAKCSFFATSPAEINSMSVGESEKQVKRLFDQARAAAPSIIFLDEIDALMPTRMGGVNLYSDKVVNQFLHEMDGLQVNKRVFVIGATNRRDMLDPALLRGGRLSREIEIPLPDLDSRRALFELYMREANIAGDVSMHDLADRSEGLSGAGIRALINEAGLQALIRIADDADAERCVTTDDFDEALANVMRPPESSEDEPFYRWRLPS